MFRIFSLMLCLATPAVADIDGPIHVIDGDTFDVGNVRVRLYGVDAPEVAQTCDDAQGRAWPCGAFVKEEISRRFEGETARCEEIDRDRYGRSVARCFVQGRDIGEEIVADGLAQAYRRYSMDYDLTEKSAQVMGLGLWAGTMQTPADFRADQRGPASPAIIPAGNCIIKGNTSGSGQIYHMPHNRDYANTRINERNGERWFCTEDEARAAGWRAARN